MKLTNKQKGSAFAALRRLLKGRHWEALNDRRGQLIEADANTPELDALQALASLRRMALAPCPAPRRSNDKFSGPGGQG